MNKYLDEMTNKEIINLAKEEKIFLGLFFNREKTVEKLLKLGYELSPKLEEKKQEIEVKNEIVLEKREAVEKIDEIDFSKIPVYRDRSRTFYRNYVNKKLMRVVKSKYRPAKLKYRNIDFYFEDLTDEQIERRNLETEINKSKFDKGPDRDIYFDREFLPECYFVDEVVLMPKNPTTLYAYWEIREDTFNKLRENNGVNDYVVIKLYKNGQEYRKITRYERIGSHFINDVDVNESYEAHIGYEDNYGNFIEVATSPLAISPRDSVSENFDLTWATVKVDENTNQLIKYVNSSKEIPNMEYDRDDYELTRENGGYWDDDMPKEGMTEEFLEKLKEVNSSWSGGSSFLGSSDNGNTK